MRDSFNTILADHGLLKVAKALADGSGAGAVSGVEFTAAVMSYAKRVHPGLRPNAAFDRVFNANDEMGLQLRKVDAAIKNRAWARAAYAERPPGAAGPSEGSAYAELMTKAAELRKRAPHLSQAQAFARVYEHPANARLAAAERGAHRPRLG
jgi:hypothetical protein